MSSAGCVGRASDLSPGGNWETTAHAKCFRRDLENRSGLLTLVLAAFHQFYNPADEFEIELKRCCNCLRCFVAFDVGLKNRIEDVIRRQRIGVFLIGTQLG